MAQTKKYIVSILIVVSCLCCSKVLAQSQKKKYHAFDRMSTTLTLSDGNAELSSIGQISKGKYWLINNELYLKDTMFDVEALDLEKYTFFDSNIGAGRVKVSIERHSIFTPILTSYRNGNIDMFRMITDSTVYLSNEIDSFYVSFLNLDARSSVYVIDNSSYNGIALKVSDKLFNSLSLGNKISYVLMGGDKLNMYYYVNGRLRQNYLYTSKEALIKDKRNKLKEFKRTGCWSD